MGTTATELENLETRLFRTGGAVFTSSLGMSTWKPGEWTEAKFQRCYTFFCIAQAAAAAECRIQLLAICFTE